MPDLYDEGAIQNISGKKAVEVLEKKPLANGYKELVILYHP